MPAIREGRHLFEFPDADGWHAFKYDETDSTKPGFYRERIGVIQMKGQPGVRGVDIVAGIQPDFQDLTLLEIKDFREDEPGLREKVLTSEMPAQIVQKALHTWGALCLGARHGDELLPPDLRVAILRPPQRLRVVLFLAQVPIRRSPNERDTRQKEDIRRKQRQGVLTKMQNHLKPLGIQSDLADVSNLPDRCGWTVTELP
ncbi:MAG: hypothetical protein EOO58_00455 [Hymenobacter sp.]|nr:MAG: hypothetical protein EOO58_00455 [Hymenobacter sp.]